MFLLEKLNNQNEAFNELHHIINLIPAKIYWKNTEGGYLGRNYCALQAHQTLKIENKKSTLESILGLSDYDIYPKETAEIYRKNDILALEKECEIIEEEPLTLPNGKIIVHLSSKTPLRNKTGKIIGVIGTSIEITRFTQESSVKDTLKKVNSSVKSIHKLSSYTKFQNLHFTPREIDVLHLLIQGQTAKKIAEHFHLSSRTIEGHIERLKIKMNANSKYDLLEKIYELMKYCEINS